MNIEDKARRLLVQTLSRSGQGTSTCPPEHESSGTGSHQMATTDHSARDPFDSRYQLPPGLPLVMEDLDRPGCYVAWRTGALDVRGYGTTQSAAMIDLERIETGKKAFDDDKE